MGNKNRTKGHNWERETVLLLKKLFPGAKTTRYANREMDDNKIDITGTEPVFHVQCKSTKQNLSIKEILDSMETKLPKVIFWKHGDLRKKGGKYVVMSVDDFVRILDQVL